MGLGLRSCKGPYMQEQPHRFGNSTVDHFDFCFASTTQLPTGIMLGLPRPARAPRDISGRGLALGLCLLLLFPARSLPDALSPSACLRRLSSSCPWRPCSFQQPSFFSPLTFIECWQLLSCLGILAISIFRYLRLSNLYKHAWMGWFLFGAGHMLSARLSIVCFL